MQRPGVSLRLLSNKALFIEKIMDSRSLCGIYGLYVILSCINPVCQDELASTSHIILLRHASNELQIIEHMYAQQ
jgi:hypothetical protein